MRLVNRCFENEEALTSKKRSMQLAPDALRSFWIESDRLENDSGLFSAALNSSRCLR